MKLNVKAMAIALGLLWGILGMFLTGVTNLIWHGYGQVVLNCAASIYPGYRATASFGQVIIGTLYGVIDGAIAGGVLAWLYNSFAN